LAYRKIAAASPFDDGIVAAALIVQGIIALAIIFYYVFKHKDS